MSFLVHLHMCSGSGGEAIQIIGSATVATIEEAEKLAETIHAHPLAEDGDHLWAIVDEIPEVKNFDDALAELKEAYVFEDWDEEAGDYY